MLAPRRIVCLLVLTVATGCGEPRDPDPGEDAIFEVTWGPLTVPAGAEGVACVVKRLGNTQPVRVNAIENQLGGISHHLILYRAATGSEEQPTPQPCDSVQNLFDTRSGAPLMIAQSAEDGLVLPAGVAFELEADQMIRLELHYVNASDQPIEIETRSRFVQIAAADFEHAADFLFIGSPDVELPPNQPSTLGPMFTPLPWELGGSKIFGVTGHTHKLGTDVFVALAGSAEGPDTPIYDLDFYDWNEPATVYYDPALEVPEGGGFRFRCEWNNTTDRTVKFGEGVDDEMCFFWAYYYPSRGARSCFHTSYGGGLDVCCPGDQLCNLIETFFD